MWGKKKIAPTAHQPTMAIQTMPREFYAGANPVVKFKTVEQEVLIHPPPSAVPARSPSASPPQAPSGIKAWLGNRRRLWWGIAGLLIIFVVGASWYYWRQATRLQPPVTVQLAEQTPPSPASENTVPVIPSTTPEETPPPLAATSTQEKIEFPSVLLGDSEDSDHDGLTEAEEELFGTDQSVPDTDADRYPDGHEVYNLYNPGGKEPEKLIESGRVKDWENPLYGYHIYYPASWAVGNVDPDYRTVLFSAITGEYVEVRVVDKGPSFTLADWLAVEAPTERQSDLVNFQSVFKVPGMRRADYLVYYFEDEKHLYIILYNTTTSPVVNYRLTVKMMARSFRLPESTNLIPRRVDIESAPTTTEGAQVVTATSSNKESATSSVVSSSTAPL